MSIANCCNAHLFKNVSQTCNADACGIVCHSIGLLRTTQTCAMCTGALVVNNTCADPFDLSTVITPPPPSTQSQCQGRTCVLCDGGDLQSVPPGAHVYTSSSCNHLADDRAVTIHNSRPAPLNNITLVLYATTLLMGYPMTVNYALRIEGTKALTINMNGTAIDNDMCAFSVVNGAHNDRVDVAIHADVHFISAQQCLLGVFPISGGKTLQGEIQVGYVTFALQADLPRYAAAIANVDGTVHSLSSHTVLYFETGPGMLSVSTPNNSVIALSALLSLFGTTYEIEYYNPKGAARVAPRMPWLPKANRMLTITAIILAGALLST